MSYKRVAFVNYSLWIAYGLISVGFLFYLVTPSKAEIQQDAQWNAVAATHHCRITAKRQGTWRAGGETAFACDDGITYWRNDP